VSWEKDTLQAQLEAAVEGWEEEGQRQWVRRCIDDGVWTGGDRDNASGHGAWMRGDRCGHGQSNVGGGWIVLNEVVTWVRKDNVYLIRWTRLFRPFLQFISLQYLFFIIL